MKNSALTQRSLSHKRFASNSNRSSENIESWDNIGLINQRMNKAQALRTSRVIFQRYQGDQILNNQTHNLNESGSALPSIDQSLRFPNSQVNSFVNLPLFSRKQQSTSINSSPIKKQIKSDKLKLLILLNSLRKTHDQELKPTPAICLLVQEILTTLKNQDNIYGDDMRKLFSVINEMIFCQEEEIINFIAGLDKHKHDYSKYDDLMTIKPYFEYIRMMKREIQSLSARLSSYQGDSQNELEMLNAKFAAVELKCKKTIEESQREIKALQTLQSEELHRKQQIIEGLQDDLLRSGKENSSLREQYDRLKLRTDELEAKLKSQTYLVSDLQDQLSAATVVGGQKAQEEKKIFEKADKLSKEVIQLRRQLEDMTPRPTFDIDNLLEPLGIDGTTFGILSSIEKARIFLDKTEEKFAEMSQLSLEKQSSKRTGRQVDPINTRGLKSQKTSSLSPTKRNSPTKQSPDKLSPSMTPDSDNIIKRNTKKSQTISVQPGFQTDVQESDLRNENSQLSMLKIDENEEDISIIHLDIPLAKGSSQNPSSQKLDQSPQQQ